MTRRLFICDPDSKNQVRIPVAQVFSLLSEKAYRECGLHHELYDFGLMEALRRYMERLNESDAVTLKEYAEKNGVPQDEESYLKVADAEYAVWAALRKNKF